MNRYLIACLAAVGLATFATGCSESSETSGSGTTTGGAASSAVDSTKSAVESAAGAVSEAAKKAGETTAAEVKDAAKAVQGAVADAGAAAQQKVNDLIAEARKLIADGKGSEALQKIKAAVANLKLTPEQQKMIDDLTKQAQAALAKTGAGAEAAAKAVGEALKPKN